MSDLCDSVQAIAAMGYLRHSFGSYPIPPDEQRPYLRLFVQFTPTEVREAIDHSTRTADRRPSPNDLARVLRGNRSGRHGPFLTDEDLTDPAEVPEWVAKLRDPESDLRKVPT